MDVQRILNVMRHEKKRLLADCMSIDLVGKAERLAAKHDGYSEAIDTVRKCFEAECRRREYKYGNVPARTAGELRLACHTALRYLKVSDRKKAMHVLERALQKVPRDQKQTQGVMG
jgi:hypothetical protein